MTPSSSVPTPPLTPPLLLRVGFEMEYECPRPTPMLLALNIHFSRASDLVQPDQLRTTPPVPLSAYIMLWMIAPYHAAESAPLAASQIRMGRNTASRPSVKPAAH